MNYTLIRMKNKMLYPQSNLLKGLFFGIIAAFIWAMFPAITRLSIEQTLSLWDIIALRFLVAGPLLLPFFLRHKFLNIPPIGIVLLVAGAGAPYLIIAVLGLSYTPASHFGVIVPSCMLVFAALGSWYFLNEKINLLRTLGMTTIIIGIFTISWEGLSASGENIWIGDLLFIVGGLFWASYTVASRYWKVQPLHAISIVSVISMFIYLPPYFIFLEPRIFSAPVTEVLWQAFFQGILSVLIALLFYTRAVELLGASKGALFAALVPSFALLIAYPVLNEIPTTLQLGGVLFVTLGMLMALGILKPRKS